jgi:hypothetical protein
VLDSTKEGHVTTAKKSRRARGTHCLESAEARTSKGQGMKRASGGHSRTGNHRRKDQLGRTKKAREGGTLTYWKAQGERQVKPVNESEQVRGTHKLEGTEGVPSQDSKRRQGSEGHSLAEKRRDKDK